jgi:hypothetical protein
MNKIDKSYDGIAKSFDELEKRMDRCQFALILLNGLIFGSLLTQLAYKFL